MKRSKQLFVEAQKYIPGGVNSPVRAFRQIGSHPRFIERGDNAYLYDADGNKYVDYVCSWGPMILGHNHPAILENVIEASKKGLSFGASTEMEVKMAKLICDVIPSVEMVRMVNSGTEAVMSAIRVARGYTGKDKIIKFDGCYHGHFDALLVKAGSGLLSAGIPDSLGVPKNGTKDTLSAVYNDLESVKKQFLDHEGEIACIIVEPVAANMGVVLPNEGFLKGLRQLCTKHHALLIFDEVITGFRLGLQGASGYFHVAPDITVFGKIIGAGMPVGAYGGRREIMEFVAPLGGVYQAGTLSGNPVAMTAGYTQLLLLKQHPEYYEQIHQSAEYLFGTMKTIIKEKGLPCVLNHVGSLGCLFFTENEVTDYDGAKASDTEDYSRYCNFMLEHGIYLAPSQFEAMFLSLAHTEERIIEDTITIFKRWVELYV